MRNGGDALIEQLLADNFSYMFGNPGTAEQGFLDALCRFPAFNYILCLQEAAAIGIADGYARATQRPAIVQLHAGVGLGNAVGMLFQAMRGHTPMVILAGEAGIRYDAMEAQMAADLLGIARPVTKWAARVLDPSSLLRIIRRAIKVASTPPMGPVFISLPADVIEAPNDEDVIPTSIPSTRVYPSSELIQNAAELLVKAKNPLILMGDGVASSGADAELARVAEIWGAEVWGAESSEINLSFRHPLFCGLLNHVFGSLNSKITTRADAVLIVGTYVFPEVYPKLAGMFAPGSVVVQIDLNAYDIAKNFPVDLGLVSDPKLTLSALAEKLEARMTAEQKEAAMQRCKIIGEGNRTNLEENKRIDAQKLQSERITPPQFFQELAGSLPEDVVIFDEALSYSDELLRYFQPHLKGQYFQTREGSLGVGLPGAVGLKLAFPQKIVVGFSGDGASLYTFQALWTAAHYGINAKFVVLNNRSYQLLKTNLDQYWREQNIAAHPFPPFFDLIKPDIDFVSLGNSLGVPGLRVDKPQQITDAIQCMLNADTPFLIELRISDEQVEDLVD